MTNKTKLATFGGGCFWCTEALFSQLKGVTNTKSGYAGGTAETANYFSVSSKTTKHAEVIQIEFNPEVIPFEILVKVHLTTHNPTTMNRQGADRGTQYRSTIFYHDNGQKQAAENVIKELQEALDDPIVTNLEFFEAFFEAEENHQNYYAENPLRPYCQTVIIPKLQKLRKQWRDWLVVN